MDTDIAIGRHVLEHIYDPINFLKAIHALLSRSSRPQLFVEVPNIAWILQHHAMQDLFYEHCNYFSAATLRFALARAGFRAYHMEEVFNGQYLWVEARAAER